MNWHIDEDCLTLNIWTPAADDGRRAVMFWIHGGGYLWESSGDLLYHGARLAARGDVVVVSVEYRLGAFGFSYFEEVPGSGNAGLLDQVLALRWVQENITAFGGDPDNVTIWGESAGSYSVCAILGMSEAEGLFHKGIGRSGGSSSTRRPDYAMRATELLYDFSGVNTVEELRALSWEEVLRAQERLMESTLLPDSIFGSVIDGVPVYEPSELSRVVEEDGIAIGVIATPPAAAQGAADRLVEDHEVRLKLGRNAVDDVSAYYPEGPALRILEALFGPSAGPVS